MRYAPALFCLCAAAGVGAAICDATYYLQGGTQYVRTEQVWSSRTVLSNVSTHVYPDLAGLTVIDTNTIYDLVEQYNASCASAVKSSVHYKYRKKGASLAFVDSVRNNLFVDIFDTNELRLVGGSFVYCFALGTDTAGGRLTPASLQIAITQKVDGGPFILWYGAVQLLDSTKGGTGRWTANGSLYFPNAQVAYDSTQIDSGMVAALGLSVYNDANRHGLLKVQVLKLEYDSVPPAAVAFRPGAGSGLAGARSMSVFQGRSALVFNVLGQVAGRFDGQAVRMPAGSGYCIVRSADGRFVVPAMRLER
jgi:hypothetical protein